jgi:hypothetical protein
MIASMPQSFSIAALCSFSTILPASSMQFRSVSSRLFSSFCVTGQQQQQAAAQDHDLVDRLVLLDDASRVLS